MAKQIATHEEIMRFWCLNDVMRWHEILDAQEDYEWDLSRQPPRER